MNHFDLLIKAEEQLKCWKCSPIVTELVTCNNTGEIPDTIGWTCRGSILFECKASRADFLRDRNKLFRYDLPDRGMGDFRFYLGNPGVVRSADELPAGWGYYEVNLTGGKPLLLHKFGVKYHWSLQPPLCGNKHNEIIMLRSVIRRKGGYISKSSLKEEV